MPVYRLKVVIVERKAYRLSTTIEASTKKEVEDGMEENGNNWDMIIDSVEWKEKGFSPQNEELETIEECQEKPEFRFDADGALVRIQPEQ